MGKFLGTVGLPEVASLPAAGTKGRLFTLTTNNHVYHDNGTTWDDLNATGAGSVWTEYEIDFGTLPRFDALFTITDAAVSSTSKIIISETGKPATGRVAGDSQWDYISLAALPVAGSFTVYAMAIPGPVVGKRKIQYQVN